jgi:predicted transcriptional regulator of viral defense system
VLRRELRTTCAVSAGNLGVMPELRQFRNDSRYSISTERIGRVAARQWGVVSTAQLRRLGHNRMAVSRLVERGYLHPLHPAVYAVGHSTLATEGRLVAALFHAGSGAALSHTTAAWWWRVMDVVPRVIHVATTHRPVSAKGVRYHRRETVIRTTERRLPVTPVPRTLLDLAATVESKTLRRALAEADHRNLLDAAAARRECGRGRRGSRALRHALFIHLPQLARTDSDLEVEFLLLVESAGLPMPEPNAYVEGVKVDALWRKPRLVVELDGHATHANPVANEEDRRRELILRRAGYRVVRYTWQQVTRSPSAVVSDLRRELE